MLKQKYHENLESALMAIQKADHIVYMTYPLIKDKKLLLLAFEETYKALLSIINAILQYEYVYKRIRLYKGSKDNFDTFKICAKRYEITEEELEKILEIFKIYKKHKESGMEFMRGENITILMDNFKNEQLNPEKIKSFINLAKSLFKKLKQRI